MVDISIIFLWFINQHTSSTTNQLDSSQKNKHHHQPGGFNTQIRSILGGPLSSQSKTLGIDISWIKTEDVLYLQSTKPWASPTSSVSHQKCNVWWLPKPRLPSLWAKRLKSNLELRWLRMNLVFFGLLGGFNIIMVTF